MPEVPRPGPPLSYVEWCRVLVGRERDLITSVPATHLSGVIYLLHADEVVAITDDRGTFWVRRTGLG
jgi:hypothetical protein